MFVAGERQRIFAIVDSATCVRLLRGAPKGVGEHRGMKLSEKRVFVSHATEDGNVARKIVAQLEAAGVQCWIAPRDIPPRAIYAEAIAEAIKSTQECFVLVSRASNKSEAVKREVELASKHQRSLVPVMIETVDLAPGLDYFLSNVQWVDYSREGAESIERLAANIQNLPPPAVRSPPSKRRRAVLAGVFLVAVVVAVATSAWFLPGARDSWDAIVLRRAAIAVPQTLAMDEPTQQDLLSSIRESPLRHRQAHTLARLIEADERETGQDCYFGECAEEPNERRIQTLVQKLTNTDRAIRAEVADQLEQSIALRRASVSRTSEAVTTQEPQELINAIAQSLGLSSETRAIPCRFVQKVEAFLVLPENSMADSPRGRCFLEVIAAGNVSVPAGEYILYNETWFREVVGSDRAQAVALFGHELGHIVNRDLSPPRSLAPRRNLELGADQFAGCALARMNEERESAENLFARLRPEQSSDAFPGRAESLEALRRGYVTCGAS